MEHQADYWQRNTVGRRALLRGASIAGAGLAGAALIGCGGSAGAPKATPAASSGATGAPAAGAKQPKVSDALVMIQTRDAPSLDPLDSQVRTTPERISLVYPRLINVVRANDNGDTKQAASYAVEGWEWNGDGTKVTFKLRKGVKYQNLAPVNGREFVAADVKSSLDRYMNDPKSTFKARYSDISKIETPDNYTVAITLKSPSRYAMSALAAEPSWILPPELKPEDMKTKAVGPGPFIHDQFLQGEGSKLHKNPDFIDAAKIYYNKYQIKVITDPATRIAAIKTNQADALTTGGVTKSELKTAEGPSVKSYQDVNIGCNGLWFNMRNPKWKDIRARMAISKAFDRQADIDQIYQGDGQMVGPIPTGFGKWAYSDKELREFNAYKYDPAEAKKLWDAAGKPSTSNEYYIRPKAQSTTAAPEAELLAGQIEKNLGIKATYKTEDYTIFLPKGYNNQFEDICLFGYSLGGEPLDYLLLPYMPGGARNGSGLNDPDVAKRLDELKATLDDTAAVAKARDIQKHILDNVMSMAHMTGGNTYATYNAKLQNWQVPAAYPYGIEYTLLSWKE